MHVPVRNKAAGNTISFRPPLFGTNPIAEVPGLNSSEVALRDAYRCLPGAWCDVSSHLQRLSKAPSKVAVVAAPASHDPIEMHAIKAQRRPSCRSARSTFHLRI